MRRGAWRRRRRRRGHMQVRRVRHPLLLRRASCQRLDARAQAQLRLWPADPLGRVCRQRLHRDGHAARVWGSAAGGGGGGAVPAGRAARDGAPPFTFTAPEPSDHSAGRADGRQDERLSKPHGERQGAPNGQASLDDSSVAVASSMEAAGSCGRGRRVTYRGAWGRVIRGGGGSYSHSHAGRPQRSPRRSGRGGVAGRGRDEHSSCEPRSRRSTRRCGGSRRCVRGRRP